MCSQSSPVGEEKQRKRSTTKNEKKKKKKKKTTGESTSKILSDLGPSRKIRSKTRKPKFLSLKLELNTSHDVNTPNPNTTSTTMNNNNKKKKKLRKQNKNTRNTTPFQSQTETLYEKEGYAYHYDAVAAYLFNSAADSAISSIHDLLDSSSAAAAANDDCGGRVLSPYDHRDHGSSVSSSLVRTAMRRGASEEAEEETAAAERWVSYSEVVEEVMSRSGTPRWSGGDDPGNVVGRPSLSLKLDYQQIMEAWSDKGPLCVDGEPPQTVPDLYAAGFGNVSDLTDRTKFLNLFILMRNELFDHKIGWKIN